MLDLDIRFFICHIYKYLIHSFCKYDIIYLLSFVFYFSFIVNLKYFIFHLYIHMFCFFFNYHTFPYSPVLYLSILFHMFCFFFSSSYVLFLLSSSYVIDFYNDYLFISHVIELYKHLFAEQINMYVFVFHLL